MKMPERGRVVVITGAGGRGCGRSIAARFATDGAGVVVSDINEAGCYDTVRLIERNGGRGAFFRADVREEAHARRAVCLGDYSPPVRLQTLLSGLLKADR